MYEIDALYTASGRPRVNPLRAGVQDDHFVPKYPRYSVQRPRKTSEERIDEM